MDESEKVRLGIITAMDEELVHLRESLINEELKSIAGFDYYKGEIEGVKVVLLRCGIGKVSSAIGTSLMVNLYAPEAIINSGSAGGMDSKLNVLDIVVSSKLAYHDVDVTVFGYDYGQMCGMPAIYEADKNLVAIATDAISDMKDLHSTVGMICSGDSFISSTEHTEMIKSHFPEVKAVEMEGASIAQSCFLMNTPFVVIRAISDIPGKESNYKDFKEFLIDAGMVSAQMVINIVKRF